jgi:hypothetical protein
MAIPVAVGVIKIIVIQHGSFMVIRIPIPHSGLMLSMMKNNELA